MKIVLNWKWKEIKQAHVTSSSAPQVNHSKEQSSWMDAEYLVSDEEKVKRQMKFLK